MAKRGQAKAAVVEDRSDRNVADGVRCRTTALMLMRMAAALLDRSGDGEAAARLQHAIDTCGLQGDLEPDRAAATSSNA